MTVDLGKLADALKRDTQDKLLERQIKEQEAEIRKALREGRDFVLDGSRRIVIKKAS